MPSTTAKTCEFCGKELEARYIDMPFSKDGAKRKMFVGYAECDCAEAVKACEKEAAAEAERERKAEQDAFYRKLEQAGVPRRYHKASHPMAKDLAAKVEGGQSLYVWGDNGTLKTTLASAIARRLVYHGKRVRMVNAVDLLIEVQSTYGTPLAESDVLAKYSKVPFLILDDLGKEQQTAWTVSRLYSIVNARDGAMLPTVITSNFRVSELAARMAACDESTAKAIGSRLAGICETVATDGGDRRLQ